MIEFLVIVTLGPRVRVLSPLTVSDLAVVLVSFPRLPNLLALVRLARLVRLLRLATRQRHHARGLPR